MRSVACLCVLALLAPPSRAEGPLSRREKGDLAIQARAILKKHCAECHGGAESRGTIRVLEYGRLTAAGPNPVPFIKPDDAVASQVIQLVEDGSMPPGDRPRPTEEEIQVLRKWIGVSAPSYPRDFDDRATLDAMLADLREHAEDAPHLRYFSLAHLVRNDGPPADLKKVEFELQRALLWCGVKPPKGRPAAEPVDGTATLFRFDVRDAGWDHRELFYRSPRSGLSGIYPLTAYDLILLEYPYGFGVSRDDTVAKPLAEYFRSAGLVRGVPFLRAEWVARMLAVKAPLAEDLRSLGELSDALKKQGSPALGKEQKTPCGPATRPFAGLNPVPAAPRATAAEPILPLSAWYSGDCLSAAPPVEVTFEAIDVSGKPLKEISTGTPFQFRVTAAQPVHFVLVNVFTDGDVEVLRTKQGGFLAAGKHMLTDSGGQPFKVTGILTGEPKATEYFVFFASTEKFPPPVVVQSRHSDSPDCRDKGRYQIFRFVFDADGKFDQSRLVRRVVAMTVTAK